MRVFNKKGQNMAEYSILIALVVAAAVGIKLYVQRGIQARVHDQSDALVNQISGSDFSAISNVAVTANKQYEPDYFSKQATTDTTQNTEDYTLTKGGTTSKDTTKTTSQAAQDYEQQDYSGAKN